MAAPMSDRVREVKQAAFLRALSTSGVVRIAAEAAGIHRSTHEYWREHYPDYARLEKAAMEDAADVCEAEAFRRGMVGMRQYKFYEGKPIMWAGPDGLGPKAHYYEDKRSDACLIVTLKARRPEKFRERHEVTGAGGGPLSVIHANIGLARLIHGRPELAQQLRDLASAADADNDRVEPSPGTNGAAGLRARN